MSETHCPKCNQTWCCHVGDGHDTPICPRPDVMDDKCPSCLIAALRLALETATREAEEERRTAEAAVKFLGRIAEVTWEAGLPSGDREQTLKNVRVLASRPAPPADAPLPLPPECTHDPSLVCLRCRVVIPMPAPPSDAAREAVRYWTFQTEWGDGYRPAAVLFQTERIASLVREQNVRLELNVGPVIAVDVPLSSPAPAPSAPAMLRVPQGCRPMTKDESEAYGEVLDVLFDETKKGTKP